jgi:hypothetical protein
VTRVGRAGGRRLVVALSIATPLAVAPSPARAEHPPDPYAALYVAPPDDDVGTAAGQVGAFAGGLVAMGRAGPEVGAQGTLELMTSAYLGIRASLAWTALRPSGQPMVLAAMLGPSLHLLPYRAVDIAFFFEGGFAGVDLTGRPTAMPVVSPGLALEVWLTSWAFLRGEGRVEWGIYGQSDAALGYLRFVVVGGPGIAI